MAQLVVFPRLGDEEVTWRHLKRQLILKGPQAHCLHWSGCEWLRNFCPVKHGLVERVKDWPYSSFHRYVKAGVYPENWGSNEVIVQNSGFGEF